MAADDALMFTILFDKKTTIEGMRAVLWLIRMQGGCSLGGLLLAEGGADLVKEQMKQMKATFRRVLSRKQRTLLKASLIRFGAGADVVKNAKKNPTKKGSAK